ncbi:unnamed protein product [Cyclocybe aegerita]|uniref:BTB domain-containing protein n=1 Tax=Cyclocybe aegerita TaxID=1973307 RepID=A0A8S0WMH8_CYCAE|nr:unnamed protein product [Cyclocybe aegerita]
MGTNSPFKRHESLWLEDGNVILQAEDTQFRVHRSMLARHSTIFKDIFSIPQQDQIMDPIVDGCPVVSLSDSAEDLEHILLIFYDNHRFLDLREKLSVGAIAAMLRMGKKYDIAYVQDEALRRLRREFPTTIMSRWQLNTIFNVIDYGPDASKAVSAIIALAREHGVPSILPAAFLHYIETTMLEEILDTDDSELPRDARRQCILGRDKFIHTAHSKILSWLHLPTFMPAHSCAQPTTCHTQRDAVFKDLCNTLCIGNAGKLQWELVLHLARSIADSLGERRSLCTACTLSISSCIETSFNELWLDLPNFFRLPGWDQLKDFDSLG